MAEVRFYKMILNEEETMAFLKQTELIIDSEVANIKRILCRNIHSVQPTKGLYEYKRNRNISRDKALSLSQEGQNIIKIPSLGCKSWHTCLSPRITRFLNYFDGKGRANCKLSPDIETDSVELLDISLPIIIDWNNYCRNVCLNSNTMNFIQRKLGDGNGTRVDGQTPNVAIQIDKCLLRGQRMLNRGRLSRGDEKIDQGDRAERNRLNTDQRMHPNRNYGMRIRGPWIFGLRSNKHTLLPIVRDNVSAGSMVWTVEWAPYRSIGGENDGILHESFNGVHAQNIERVWSSLKHHILRSMKNT
ncbi:hypothetical protein RF11_16167 [Thelohanellus kitauei]|uniref:ISXO2-like transposase domain-containing protein n=1 Tax=Thelohanellus kitauei TaxID=669202 RepID=A0A0C2NKP0_THEKT|nr:hypothetical protein RF11_16167 [Thelohanellus kitauei]